jgi:hypothetical protein
MIRALEPLVRHWQIFFFSWALTEINPLHEDVPYIVRRLNELRSPR